MSRERVPDSPGRAAQTANRTAVVIPCYNEALTVEKVVSDFAAALPAAAIYVFDNNSTDGTAELARRAGAEVVCSPRQGKANVVRHMMRVVDADTYVLVDGDDTYPASAAPMLLETFENKGADLLVGTRLQDAGDGAFPRFHRLGNRVITWWISRLFSARLTDVLSGYRVMSRDFVNDLHLESEGFEVESEMTMRALVDRRSIVEVPVAYRARPEGSLSKLGTWRDGLRILRCIFTIGLVRRRAPLRRAERS